MEPRRRRVEDLFHQARALPPSERAAFLRSRCDDDAMRAELDSLLAVGDGETHPALRAPRREPQEHRIGPYRVLETIGEGGMGTVYLAEGEEPLRRVAIKTLRVGTGSEELAERFEGEVQVLALMEHPGIARLYHAGRTASGLPYLVMEHVPGRPLIEECDRRRLGVDRRVALFVAVCGAVQHAHQKGVVHRDLKPSNVLATEQDDELVPKVIDFGIARALAGPFAGAARDAGLRRVGTLLSMSPEQLEPGRRDVDTRADVYALGTILYELLAGVPPFDPEELAALDEEERERTVATVEPLAPSERLRRMGAGAGAIAAARGTDARSLVRVLAEDLDYVVAKAMRKDRTQRYASASELGADLERFLGGAPVVAAPATLRYRGRKLLRRRRVPVAAAAAALVALVATTAFTTSALVRARRAEAAERAQRLRAESNLAKSDAFVDFFRYGLSHTGPWVAAGEELTVRDLLVLSIPSIEPLFGDRPEAQAAVHLAVGSAFLELGEDELALRDLLRAHALLSDAPASDPRDRFFALNGLIQAERRLRGTEAASELVQRSVELAREVLEERRPEIAADVAALVELAGGGDVAGDDALEHLDRVLAAFPGALRPGDEAALLYRPLLEAAVALRRRDDPAATPYLERCAATARRVVEPDDVRLLTTLWRLAIIALLEGHEDFAAAEAYARELAERAPRALPPDHWMRTDADRLLALALAGVGDVVEAERALLRASETVGRAGERGNARATWMREAVERFCDAVDAREGGLDAFLDASWRRCLDAPGGDGAREPWWPVLLDGVPHAALGRAVRILESDSDEPRARVPLALGLVSLGAGERALAILAELSDDPVALAARALVEHDLGRAERARATVAELDRRLLDDAQPLPSALHARIDALRRTLAR